MIAAVASFSVMVSVMNLSGYVVVGNGHPQADVFTVISAHIVGMYALVLVVGRFVDDMGRRPALIGGLLVEAVSAAGHRLGTQRRRRRASACSAWGSAGTSPSSPRQPS